MDNIAKNSLLRILQKEFIRRNLIKYFEEKGYNNFLVKPYPPTMLDLVDEDNSDILEIKYYLEDINMKNNTIKFGWNLFLLGNKRIFLGYTNHRNLAEVESSKNNIDQFHDGPITIKALIESIVEILGNSEKLKEVYNSNNNKGYGNMTKLSMAVKPYKQIPNFSRRV